ncbi:MAG TPA: right-handed parallel beta-helix repeat-containing protein [Candidatus Saccharimonadales bacterium]|nr:right-handed parallel beta-helix repeat-containing protein [Candidatus Saccharimonadales bacterium]
MVYKVKEGILKERISRLSLFFISLALAIFASLAITKVTSASSHCDATLSSGDSVKAAVDSSSSGDTICLEAGDYVVGEQVVIDNNLTIEGADTTTTVVRADFDTGTGGDARGWFLVNSGIEFNVNNLTLDGDGHKVWQAIRHKGPGTVDNVHFTDIRYFNNGTDGSPYNGNAIAAFGTGNVDVTNSEFDNIGRIGVLYFGTGISGSLFDNNTYTGKGVGDWLDYALDISNGANVTVTNNTISNNLGVASSDGSTSAGILVSTFFGPDTTALIENNDLSGNTTAIYVGFDSSDTSTVEAHQNNIQGNDNGVISTNPEVDATCNWWGSPTGPTHSSNPSGTGDEVSDNVLFDPWLTGPAPEGECNSPVPLNKDECKKGGYETFGFRNQGQCIRFVNTGQDSRVL